MIISKHGTIAVVQPFKIPHSTKHPTELPVFGERQK
jgi:hypothetical protein